MPADPRVALSTAQRQAVVIRLPHGSVPPSNATPAGTVPPPPLGGPTTPDAGTHFTAAGIAPIIAMWESGGSVPASTVWVCAEIKTDSNSTGGPASSGGPARAGSGDTHMTGHERRWWVWLVAGLVLVSAGLARAEEEEGDEAEDTGPVMSAGTFAGLKFRNVGPALMSGRVADFAVDPANRAHYYVAVASGGVWKTTNAGTTFTPVFDGQGSYSIGCVTLDPKNPAVVWVGTGENNSQRSVSFGDGVYRSRDGGQHWDNLGLRESEHIGMILVDPRDSDTVYVAAQGPLWRAGGDRGLYKTTNGGKTWTRILNISNDTGVNEVHCDPRDPDVLYASSYQRRRHVWTLINGGPESAIYKSTDAGATWRKLSHGIPGGDLGRIGLDVSPADPDVIYAIVEASNGKGGFFRSTDRGETWHKRSGYETTSGQYYNEILCDPNDVDRVYVLDTILHVTDDGGKTWQRMPRNNRHVDDHALWIDPADSDYLLVGCDGGVYETFDRGANWRYMPNLPVTQFYRVSADEAVPFYNVYGGTQDNSSVGGPSRTRDTIGIANEHWYLTMGGDGYETVIDPEDPNIVYSQMQYGGLVRFDRRSGERLDIKPREAPGEPPLRFNWDTPLILSPHDHHRLYFAAQKLFRSDDQGHSWTAVSGDLTRQLNRDTLEIMGRIPSPDAVAKSKNTSWYGNIVALDESPLVEGLIYVGTDDGLIQVTEDGGEHWRRIALFPEIPDRTYVSCVLASRHDPDTVYAAFDNHKHGDFTPYLLKSTDRGQEWTRIAGDLPERDIVYTIGEDHEQPNLLFVGTEFGAYFTVDGGEQWIRLKGGLPTIAVRDLDIQRRENDLVLGTFGRGIYILDDYTPLRLATKERLSEGPVLFPVKETWRYVQESRLGGGGGRGSQGASFWSAPNPPYGAVFTYYLKDKLTTRKERRQEAEQKARKANKPFDYPTMEELRAEDEERPPRVLLVVEDAEGNVIRRVPGSRSKGLHRASWDLRYPATTPVAVRSTTDAGPSGPLALPGVYRVTLAQEVDGELTTLAGPEEFAVVPLDVGTFQPEDRGAVLTFRREVAELQRAVHGALRLAGEAHGRVLHARQALLETPDADLAWLAEVETLDTRLRDLLVDLRGDRTLQRREEPQGPSIMDRINGVAWAQYNSTQPPTQTHRAQYEYAGELFADALAKLKVIVEEDLPALEAKLDEVHAPWTPGRVPEWEKQ